MYCPKCGAQATTDARFCGECGATLPPYAAPSGERVRPAIVTLLAVLKFLAGTIWMICGLALVADTGRSPGSVVVGVVLLAFGSLALACGYGLWTLRAYGRYVQMIFSFLGLLLFPLQTIISILILVYMFNSGVRVLFSGTPIDRLSETERMSLRSLQAPSATAIVVAIAVAIPVLLVLMGVMAAIAIPNLLNAIDRGKQKRTMADLQAIGIAVESYAEANDAYPVATTAEGLKAAIEPLHLDSMPTLDGWGNAFQVDSAVTGYTIYSAGKDGIGSDCALGETVRFNEEICFTNGQFIRYPAGSQQ